MESTPNENEARLSIPPSLVRDNLQDQTKAGIFFSLYQTATLFPLKNITENDTIIIGTSVIGATVAGVVAENLVDAVEISLQVHLEVCTAVSFFSHLFYQEWRLLHCKSM